MVQMNNVTMVYDNSDVAALDNFSLTINEGEFAFLVGPSGSGKTTIIKLLTGEIMASEGEVIVNGFNMNKLKRRKMPQMRRTLGVIFQDFRLIDKMTVYDNVAFAMRVVGATNKAIKDRVPRVLELVGLEGREKRLPAELSGGEQQRVAIARALVNNPTMIIADEPTGNLDPVRSLELMLLLEKINEMGTTILVVTHEKELVNAFSKRVIAIDGEGLHFYDAVAPIVTLESVDMESAFFASRYDKGTADYVNCPMDEAEYKAFVRELCAAKEASVHGFDDGGVFEGCMPVEVMARRGEDTLRYGPMKPVGLRDPRTGRENYAVVQLRRDNADGTLYNIVGFQTHLTWGEQKRVFSMIPALKNAEFVRYGVMHRNTYLNSPKLLDRYYRFRAEPRLSFAGQMTGVEGYVESAASGMLVGIETASRMLGFEPVDFPQETAIGALSLYISGGSVGDFQPMNVNFGIISPLGYRVKGKRNKNAEISARSLAIIEELMKKEVFGCENNS